MTKAIGPNFHNELKAAGLGQLPFTWGADGKLCFDSGMTQSQIAAVQAAYAAHDPAKKDALQQILDLEATITARRRDEAILGADNGWLANVRAEIAALRAQL